jgi:intracellular sulfur oxidation DsrE/DsrF family protein
MGYLLKAFGLALAVSLAATTAMAAPANPTPLIPGYGKLEVVENPGLLPDPARDYRVIVEVKLADDKGGAPKALDKAARLANLLAASGVPADHRHIVVVIHGFATDAVLTEAGAKAHGKGPTDAAAIIHALTEAGVSVHVCGQALAYFHIARDEVLPEIQVDLSAITTLATLQLQGYALIDD